MKKLFTLLLCVMLTLSSVSACAALPVQLTKIPLNYSSDMTFTASLENADEIVDFILSMDEHAEEDGMLDLRTLLGSLFDISGKANVKGNISKDFRKMQLYVGAEAKYNVNLNQNLDMMVTPKFGIWIDMDLTDTGNPVMDIILMSPASSKYHVLNVFEYISEEEKSQICSLLDMVFRPEFVEAYSDASLSILEKHATVKIKGSECTVTLDNDGAIALYTELLANYATMAGGFMNELAGGEDIAGLAESISGLSGTGILGKDGIRMKFVSGREYIEQETCDIDMDLNVSDIYTLITGNEWEHENELIIDFNMTASAKYYDHGRTSVDFPVLTEENSINVGDMYFAYDGGYGEDYPADWIYFNPSDMPVIDSVVYVPFEEVIREAYGDKAEITRDGGVTTAVCKDRDGDITVSVSEGSTKAYLDGTEYDVGCVAAKDGVVYVDIGFFNKVMGWSIHYANYNVITGEYSLSGSTYREEYEVEYEEPAPYPNYYASAESGYLPFEGGQVYLPLRALLEGAYGESVTLDYNDGKITAYSEYFPGFSTLEFNVGDSRVYADNQVYTTGVCFTENGVSYVHPGVFTDVLGWELEYLEKDMLTGTYSFAYTTRS